MKEMLRGKKVAGKYLKDAYFIIQNVQIQIYSKLLEA